MAGLADVHIALVLQDRWKDRFSTSSEFRSLFPAIPTSIVDQWQAKLFPSSNADFLRFGTAFSSENPNIPQVVIHAEDEPVDVAPLGYQGVHTGLADTNSMFLRETVTLSLYAGSPELTRAIHVMCRAAMLSSVPWFLGAGYDHVEYLGGGGLEQEDSLLPEELGVYIRTQRWNLTSLMTVTTGKTFSHNTVVVAHVDSTVGSVQGGAAPWDESGS